MLTVQISSGGGTVDGSVTVNGAACKGRICRFSEAAGSSVNLAESPVSSRHPFTKWQVDGATMQGQSTTITMSRKYVYVNAIFKE